jgi:hypothetical protein
MKTVDAGQFAANMNQYLKDSLSEPIVVTQEGKPCAVVHGVQYDDEQLQFVNSHDFWSMIRQRREQATIPWQTAKRQLQ